MSGSLNLSTDALQAIVAKSIVDSLTPEARAELIQGAIKAVLAPPPKRYSSDPDIPSPLQKAFNDAVEMQANKAAREMLEHDATFQAQVKKLFADVADKMFGGSDPDAYDSMVRGMASMLIAGLKAEADRY